MTDHMRSKGTLGFPGVGAHSNSVTNHWSNPSDQAKANIKGTMHTS